MQKVSLPKALGAFLSVAATATLAQTFAFQTHTTTLPDYAYRSAYPYGNDQSNSVSSANNYLADITESGSYTWALNQMPLRVFIEDGTGTPGYRDTYQDLIRRAFNEWQVISNSKLTWTEVNSAADADIVCSWTAEARPKGNGVEAGETRTTVQRSPFFSNGRIVSAHVMVLTDLFGRSFSNPDIYKTCLHEIGHALGLQGHSSTTSDIMYPVLNPSQTPYLKDRDRNTIMALYAQASDRSSIASGQYGQRPPRIFPGYPRLSPMNGGWARGFVFGNFR
jgi:predicted Zn-dependent protease